MGDEGVQRLKAASRWAEKRYPLFAASAIGAFAAAAVIFSPIADYAKDVYEIIVMPDNSSGAGLIGKLRNDFRIRPDRSLIKTDARAAADYQEIDFAFDPKRPSQPLLYSRDQERDDYVVILGAFEMPDELHGVLMLDRKGRVVHSWKIPAKSEPDAAFNADYRLEPHGVALFRDGSVVLNLGKRAVKLDACGRTVWVRPVGFHHVMERDRDRGGAWTWHSKDAVLLDSRDGGALVEISLADVEAANPDLDIFKIRQVDGWSSSRSTGDALHLNDIEPLPAAYAAAYPMFSPGDLIASARALNLIFVFNPDTLRIKWHAVGYWRRQHDPDFGADGRIYVFDNNMHRGMSRVVAIDPSTNNAETVVDGAKYDFYSSVRGKIDLADAGRILITSTQQGRVFEVDEKGEVSFEFLNRYDAARGTSLIVFQAFAVGAGEIDPAAFSDCSEGLGTRD